MPSGSPIAVIAATVAADPVSVRWVAALLRAEVMRCPCRPVAECPALSEVNFLKAMEQVVD